MQFIGNRVWQRSEKWNLSGSGGVGFLLGALVALVGCSLLIVLLLVVC